MIWDTLRLSIIIVSIATAVIAVAGTALGWLLAKRNFRGKDLLDAVLTLPMVLPPTVTGYYLILLLGRRGLLGKPLYDLTGWAVTFTWIAAVIAATVIAMPLMIKSARAAIESVDAEYEIASRIMGKSEFETFFRITLPLAGRGILAGVVLSFARAFGEFGATLMLAGNIPGRTQTLSLAIFNFVQTGKDSEAYVLLAITVGLAFAFVWCSEWLARTGKRS